MPRGMKNTPVALTSIDGGRDYSDDMPESPPAWLLADMEAAGKPLSQAAINFWERESPELNARGLTKRAHTTKFAIMCAMWAEWLTDPGDYKTVNPLRGLMSEFGMDPAASTKLLGAVDKPKPSKLAAMRQAKGL